MWTNTSLVQYDEKKEGEKDTSWVFIKHVWMRTLRIQKKKNNLKICTKVFELEGGGKVHVSIQGKCK